MKSKFFIILFLIFGLLPIIAQDIVPGSETTVSSPDNATTFTFYQKTTAEGKKQMYYSFSYRNKPVILESEIGLKVENQLFESALAIPNDESKFWCENLNLSNVVRNAVDTTWKPVYGERSIVTDRCNLIVLNFEKNSEPEAVKTEQATGDKHLLQYDRRRGCKMNLEIRVYNEGVAFRYFIPENTNGLFMHIVGEQTQFTFPEGTLAYYERWAQGPYSLLPLKNWTDECERPLTLKLTNGFTVALAEAQMIDYARGKFRLNAEKPNTLQLSMYGCADVINSFCIGTTNRI